MDNERKRLIGIDVWGSEDGHVPGFCGVYEVFTLRGTHMERGAPVYLHDIPHISLAHAVYMSSRQALRSELPEKEGKWDE